MSVVLIGVWFFIYSFPCNTSLSNFSYT